MACIVAVVGDSRFFTERTPLRPEPTLAALSRFNELVTEMEKLAAKLKAAGKL